MKAGKEPDIGEIFSNHVDEVEKTLQIEESRDKRRVFYLRPSSFPYCGIRAFLDGHEGIETTRLMSFSGSYFTGVGTTIHRVFQKFLGQAGYMIGDWECKRCRILDKFTKFHTCPKCGRPMHYRELQIKDNKGLIGHLDGLYEEPLDQDFWVPDYKSTSMEHIIRHRKTKKFFPHKFNVHQILAYVVLLEYFFKIKIRGWLLVYLPRDHPFKDRVVISGKPSKKEKAQELKKILRWIKVHRLVLRAQSVEQAQTLWKYKLCDSRKDYYTNFHDHFDPCPHVDYCFNHQMNEVISDRVEKGLNVGAYPLIQHANSKIRKELQL